MNDEYAHRTRRGRRIARAIRESEANCTKHGSPPKRTEPVLDRDTVDLLRTIIHVNDAVRDEGIPMPYITRALLDWAADEARKQVRAWENWIKEHSRAAKTDG